jgi:hypothetical protein
MVRNNTKLEGMGKVKGIILKVGGKRMRRSLTLLEDDRAAPFRPSNR